MTSNQVAKAFQSWELTMAPYGPGYRVYFTKHGSEIVILLVGGDKRTQMADIKPPCASHVTFRST